MSTVFANPMLWFEIALAILGLVLFWRHVVSPPARVAATQPALTAWNAEAVEFLLFLALIFFGTFCFSVAAATLTKELAIKGDAATLVSGAGAQFGMLAGILTFAAKQPKFRQHTAIGAAGILRSGVAAFAISLPIIFATGKAWEYLLLILGIPAERQDLIRMFTDAKSPVQLGSLILLATVVAPVTEELVFRAGIFRFLRTRAPRALAFLVPALIFASLHVNWSTLEGFASFAPLVVLAVVYSLAYERTGNIGTTIVAHALFNLNTIAQIFSGLAGR